MQKIYLLYLICSNAFLGSAGFESFCTQLEVEYSKIVVTGLMLRDG